MTAVRRIARPMLAAIFVSSGWEAVRNPTPLVPAAEPVAGLLTRLAGRARPADGGDGAPPLPDTASLVRLNGAVQLGAGLLLATGRVPRPAAAALAASLVPTTWAAHRFWAMDDPGARRQHQIQFLKNLGLLGGLLLAAVDTGGRPSLGWRARRTVRQARRRAGQRAQRAAPHRRG